MKLIIINFLLIFFCLGNIHANDMILMKTSQGDVVIELFNNLAPNHVQRIKTLSQQGKYNGVAFHRVIKGFMAQTGDTENGNLNSNYNYKRAGMGGSDLPNLKAEFNNKSHVRGIVSMARAADPNSANSQFFIILKDSTFLDGQYTVFGKVVEGMQNIDRIKNGKGPNGEVNNPDRIISMSVIGTNAVEGSKVEIANLIDKAKETCESLGFKKGTDKFADCSLKLYSQSLDLAAEQNKTVVMQPQSSGTNVMTIYDPVRDSNALIEKGMKMLSGRCTLGIDC